MNRLLRKSTNSGVSGGGDAAADDDDDVTERRGTWTASSKTKRGSLVNVNISSTDPLKRRHRDQKVVGLAEGVRRANLAESSMEGTQKIRHEKYNGDIPLEDDEKYARSKVEKRPVVLVIIGYYTGKQICYPCC